MTNKIKILYPLVFNAVADHLIRAGTDRRIKIALYKIHVQRFPVTKALEEMKLSKSTLYKYESAFDDEISYYRSFFKTYKNYGKERAYELVLEKKCSRKNADKNLKVALNDIFVKKISAGTVIEKYGISRSTLYRQMKSIDNELKYLKKIKTSIKISKSYNVVAH